MEECRKEQPFVISLPAPLAEGDSPSVVTETPQSTGTAEEPLDTADTTEVPDAGTHSPMDTTPAPAPTEEVSQPSTSSAMEVPSTAAQPDYSEAKTGLSCLPQRAALIKSMLNFLKKAIQEPGFSESMRHLMEGSLPASLKHIISNAEYYGASLFLLATDVVTVYVFGEPSLLSSLQDNGLTDVVLHALLVKDVSVTVMLMTWLISISLPNCQSHLFYSVLGIIQSLIFCIVKFPFKF